MDIPLKSQLLKSFEENDDVWEDNAFNALLSNENISSEQWKWHCRFWLSEMAAAGLLETQEAYLHIDQINSCSDPPFLESMHFIVVHYYLVVDFYSYPHPL